MKEKGITLIALIITIVLLIILAFGIIGTLFGKNGLINRAKEAGDLWEKASQNEMYAISELEKEIDGIYDEDYEKGEIILKDAIPKNISEAKSFGTIFEEKITLEDDLGNKVTIPAGFKVAEDSSTTVGGGIVIEDIMAGDSTSNGNQFVWIPVGEYTNNEGKQTNVLATREFTADGATIISTNPDNTNSDLGEEYTIQYFKSSAEQNGGFYLARYEAGGYISISIVSKPNHETCGNMFTKIDGVLTGNPDIESFTTQIYSNNETIKSNLANMYARDTAINFICQNSSMGYNTAVETGIGLNTKGLTGNNPKDCFSNIYDMAGNASELVLEKTLRGGNYKNTNSSISYKMPLEYWEEGKEYQMSDFDHYGFRFVIYLAV